MTPLDEIGDLYGYHRWANGRMLDAVATLTPEEFTRDLGGSFGTVRATLAHMLGADWIWLSRWQGTSPSDFPTWFDDPFDALRARWREVEAAQRDFVEGLAADDLHRVVAYRNMAGAEATNELWQLLRHVVNHATYHRGQVTHLLRELGREAPATDLVIWYRLP